MDDPEDKLSIRTPFNEIIFNNSHNFNYVTGFSNNSIILVFAIGIYELFARFKNKPICNCLKILKNELKALSDKAKESYPEKAGEIDFYMNFLQEVEKFQDSETAFKYLLQHTLFEQEKYVHITEIGFRLILSMLFENKPQFKAMVKNGSELYKLKGLIFHKICHTLGIQIDIYDISDKEVHKGPKIGEFPILNIFSWNSQYYLLYNQNMINEWNGIALPDTVKDQPPFKLQKTYHAPIQSNLSPIVSGPTPIQNPPTNQVTISDFNDTNGILKQLVVKLSEELLKQGNFSDQFSDFVGLCIKNNQEVSSINTLHKFMNPFKEESNKKIVAAEFEVSDILMESKTSIQRSARNINTTCSICRRQLSMNYFPNINHTLCKVCYDCARPSSYCKACNMEYTADEMRIIRK